MDAGAAEVLALLEPRLVTGAVDVVAGGVAFVVVGAAGCVTVFTASVTVCAGGAAACCVTVLTEPPHPPIKSPVAVVTAHSFPRIQRLLKTRLSIAWASEASRKPCRPLPYKGVPDEKVLVSPM